MPPEVLDFLTAELGFFDTVTDISGALYTVPKDERKAGAVKLAREVSCLYSTHPACYVPIPRTKADWQRMLSRQ